VGWALSPLTVSQSGPKAQNQITRVPGGGTHHTGQGAFSSNMPWRLVRDLDQVRLREAEAGSWWSPQVVRDLDQVGLQEAGLDIRIVQEALSKGLYKLRALGAPAAKGPIDLPCGWKMSRWIAVCLLR
jgi:hypothetical protein